MGIFHALINFIHWIYALLIYGNDNSKKQKQIEFSPPVNPEDVYYTQTLARFQDTYRNFSSTEMNANIDSVFYSAAEFKTSVELADNDLELAWRRRQMNVWTPRGNVIIYYDAFKMGFAYYSDQFMPYKILNSVAMKYVIAYRCRDFFVDETVLMPEHKSALIDVHVNEKPNANANANKSSAFVVPKDAPMAKLKSQRVLPTQSQPALNTNRFIHLGAVRNYKPLIEKKKANPINGFKSDAIPKPVMTYKQYKIKET